MSFRFRTGFDFIFNILEQAVFLVIAFTGLHYCWNKMHEIWHVASVNAYNILVGVKDSIE